MRACNTYGPVPARNSRVETGPDPSGAGVVHVAWRRDSMKAAIAVHGRVVEGLARLRRREDHTSPDRASSRSLFASSKESPRLDVIACLRVSEPYVRPSATSARGPEQSGETVATHGADFSGRPAHRTRSSFRSRCIARRMATQPWSGTSPCTDAANPLCCWDGGVVDGVGGGGFDAADLGHPAGLVGFGFGVHGLRLADLP